MIRIGGSADRCSGIVACAPSVPIVSKKEIRNKPHILAAAARPRNGRFLGPCHACTAASLTRQLPPHFLISNVLSDARSVGLGARPVARIYSSCASVAG